MSEKDKYGYSCRNWLIAVFILVLSFFILYVYKSYWIGSDLKVSLGNDAAAWAGAFANFAVAFVTGLSVLILWRSNKQQQRDTHRRDVKNIIDRLEVCITEVAFQANGSPEVYGEDALKELYELYLKGEESEFLFNTVKTRKVDSFFNLYCMLINELFNGDDQEYLQDYFKKTNYSKDALVVVFLLALTFNRTDITEIIHKKLDSRKFNLPLFCKSIINKIMQEVCRPTGLNVGGMFELLDRCINVDPDGFDYGKNIAGTPGNRKTFNNNANKFRAKFRLKEQR